MKNVWVRCIVRVFSSVFDNCVRMSTCRRTLRRSTREGRPDTVVEVYWARSNHCCISRGVRSLFFFPAGMDDFPGFCMTLFYFHMYVRSFVFCAGAQPGCELRRQTTFARSVLGAQTKGTDNSSTNAESYQLGTMPHDVLYCSRLLFSDPGIRHRS